MQIFFFLLISLFSVCIRIWNKRCLFVSIRCRTACCYKDCWQKENFKGFRLFSFINFLCGTTFAFFAYFVALWKYYKKRKFCFKKLFVLKKVFLKFQIFTIYFEIFFPFLHDITQILFVTQFCYFSLWKPVDFDPHW